LRIAGAGVAYVSQVALARWMGTFEYGIYAYAWSWIMLLGFMAPMGFNISVMKFLPEYLVNNRIQYVTGLVRRGPIIVLVISSALSLVMASMLSLWPELVPGPYKLALLIALTVLPIFALNLHYEALARSFGWAILAYAPAYVIRPVVLLALAGAFVAVGAKLGAQMVISMMLIVTLLAVGLQAIMVHVRTNPMTSGVRPATETRQWLKASLPLFLIEVFYLSIINLDVLMLGYFVTPEAVGIYFVAARTCSFLGYIPFGIAALAVPKYSEFHSRGDRAGLTTYVKQMNRMCLLPTLAGCIILFVLGDKILSIFGEEYEVGYTVLMLLALGVVAKAATGPVHYLLAMTDRHATSVVVLAISAALNLLLNTMLIPIWGIEGAAVATALSTTLSITLMTVISWKTLRIRSFIF
jgi:O-antigen/teichoic acid export membrane protein